MDEEILIIEDFSLLQILLNLNRQQNLWSRLSVSGELSLNA
jgi:hypothetical protein